MPISLSCQCGKEYQLSDTLAGKKGRCKSCGEVFQIPDRAPAVTKPKPIPKTAPPSAAVDLFGLDDGPTVELARSSTRATASKFGVNDADDDDDDDFAAPKRRSSRPKRPREVDEAAKAKYRGSGISMLIFGGLAFILPMIGLQWRLLSFLPGGVQFLLASGLIVLGLGSLGISCLDQPPRWLGPLALFGIVGTVVLGAVIFLPGMINNDPGPNPVQPPPPFKIPDRAHTLPTPPIIPQMPITSPNPAMPQVPYTPTYPVQNNNAADSSNPDNNNGPVQSMIPPGTGAQSQPSTPSQTGPAPVFPRRMPRPNFPRRPGGNP